MNPQITQITQKKADKKNKFGPEQIGILEVLMTTTFARLTNWQVAADK